MARQGIRALRAQIARAGAGGGRLLALCALAILPAAEPAAAAPHLPAPGQVFHGVGGGADSASFDAEVGKHSPVFQRFTTWGAPADALFASAERSRARLMVHVSTSDGPGTPERITPRAIAQGYGDAYLIGLGQPMATRGRPVYLRLMAEMNGHWNAYCAFSGVGSRAWAPPFHRLDAFSSRWAHKPFVLGEWALWGRDDPGFVRRLFRWTRGHGRTRMIIYNQGRPGGPFRLFRYPRGRAELRRQLLDPRFAAFAPEWG